MTARYAIYYVPRADTPLWRRASAWLGRDAVGRAAAARPDLPALAGLDLDALTADPRHYGFHATLKAPFELAPGCSPEDLLGAASVFASQMTPFDADIAPAALGRFLAFRLRSGEPAMQALHEACVRAFEPHRAPLSPYDLDRRRKASLTPAQDAQLIAWGYPYVFDDFRFHMTLTGAIADEPLRQRILAALTEHFASETGPHRFDGVAVFRQPDRKAPFEVVERFAFRTPVPART